MDKQKRKFSFKRRYSRKTRVRVVNDYADMTMTTRTLTANFEGFSQILKELEGGKAFGCVYNTL